MSSAGFLPVWGHLFLKLPFAPPVWQRLNGSKLKRRQIVVSNQRVVLADNDSASMKNIRTQLTRFDYWVVGESTDGITALKLVRSRQPDLLIIKAFLPGMDGLQVAKIARQDKLAPVVLVAPSFKQSVLEKAREAGAFGFL